MLADLELDFDHALAACVSGGLRELLERHPPPTAALARHAVEPGPGEPYGRRLLHQSSLGEALLMRFALDTFCAPHDHGAALAFVYVLQGELVEQRFSFESQRLATTEIRRVGTHALLEVPRHTIHCMKGSAGALALHLYAPAITGMRIYDAAARRTLVVDDDCGAWIPSDPARVRSVAAWA